MTDASVAATWDYQAWRWTANLYYRSGMSKRLEAGAPCASMLADGSDAPAGCSVNDPILVGLRHKF